MVVIHYVGGEMDGRLDRLDSLAGFTVPEGYAVRAWMGDPARDSGWRQSSTLFLIDKAVLDRGDDAVFEAFASHWKAVELGDSDRFGD